MANKRDVPRDPGAPTGVSEDLGFREGADRMPTPDEERRAEALELDPDVAEHYEEAMERGAKARGEGRIA